MPENATRITGTRASDYLPALNATIDRLKKIEALAEGPHWTTERRWYIAALATNAIKELRECITEIEHDNR